MSSRREVLIRILALLQRKTLIETKNRTLKWHYWTVRSIKNVALLTEDGAFALFFRPHPGGFDSSKVPTPGNLPSKAKNNFCLLGGHFIDFENINLFICVFIQLKFTKL